MSKYFLLILLISTNCFSQLTKEEYDWFKSKIKPLDKFDSLKCSYEIEISNKYISENYFFYPDLYLMLTKDFENGIYPSYTYYYLLTEKYNLINTTYPSIKYPDLKIALTNDLNLCFELSFYKYFTDLYSESFFDSLYNQTSKLVNENQGFTFPKFSNSEFFYKQLLKKTGLELTNSNMGTTIKAYITLRITKKGKISKKEFYILMDGNIQVLQKKLNTA